MLFLKANTAVDVLIGPFVDDTDGKTAETGLTLSQADILLSKNGQSLTQKNDADAATHDSSGYYNCELDATDTNTEGSLTLIVSESGALPVRHEYNVLSEAAYDSMFAAKDSGYMDVNIKAVSEDTTAADNLELACDNYSATRGLSGTALPAAAADAAGGLPISDDGGLDLDTQLAYLDATISSRGTADPGDEMDLVDAPNSTAVTAIKSGLAPASEYDTEMARITANVATASALATTDGKIDDIKTKTDNLPSDPAVQSAVEAAITSAHSTTDGKLDNGTYGLSTLKTLIDALPDAAAINAQVSDVIKTDTISEMSQGAPPAAPTLEEAINYLYRKLRNKEETTASGNTVYADDGTTELFKTAIDWSDPTLTKGEYTTGE